MTRLATKYLDAVDNCVRCPDRTTVRPDGTRSGTDAEHIVLMFRCSGGHCWERSFRRSALKQEPAKATTARRRHLANRAVTTTTAPTTTTTTTTTIDADRTDEANLLSKAARQPGPRTRWCPDLRAWVPR